MLEFTGGGGDSASSSVGGWYCCRKGFVVVVSMGRVSLSLSRQAPEGERVCLSEVRGVKVRRARWRLKRMMQERRAMMNARATATEMPAMAPVERWMPEGGLGVDVEVVMARVGVRRAMLALRVMRTLRSGWEKPSVGEVLVALPRELPPMALRMGTGTA
jgi:hypothetical protein